VEAAAEAARCGAEVTLLEASDDSPLPRSLWPRLLDGEQLGLRRRHLLNVLKVKVLFGMRVKSLGFDGRIQGPMSGAKFDRVVIATGSRSKAVLFPGSKKPGVHILGDVTDYLELAAERNSIEKLVVSGTGITAFEVAERLNKQGRAVTLLGRGYAPAGLCRELGELLEMRAARIGIRMSRTRLQKAVGSGPIEAVVAGSKIIPCDTLAVVPPFCPACPPGSPQPGPHGGIFVSESMCSTEGSVFAAGSCAEMVAAEGSIPISLGASASASGRVAGANAAGRHVALDVAGAFSADLFGLRVEGAGLTFDQARASGQEVMETVRADGATSFCSLVHDRATGRLVGGQMAGESCEGFSMLIASAVARRLDIGSLAYADLGSSTDISMLQDTARQGLAWR
jgi:3-phenylpropionate/trans-cinnamate dioxygenase ferredoxin reductase subunit